MSSQNPARRLAAVLIADVAGYSRLMERDEAGTHVRIRTTLSDVVGPAIERNTGHLLRIVGDGILAEFPSATAAVCCAVEIQRQMLDRNRPLRPHDRIEFRIGINLADILYDSKDIAGSGVNLAARLETLAPPGGICISQTLREQIHADLGVVYVDGGVQRVKNISKPVRVIQVRLVPPTLAERLRLSVRRVPASFLAVAVGGVALTVAASIWIGVRDGTPQTMSLEIGPFRTADSADAATKRIASAAADRLFVALGGNCYSWKLIKSSGDPGIRAGRARYRLDGVVSEVGGSIRFDVKVVHAETNEQTWGDGFTVERKNDEALILGSHRIALGVEDAVTGQEIKRLKESPPARPTALELAMMAAGEAYESYAQGKSIAHARPLYERALEQDPNQFIALKDLARFASTLEEADELSQRVITKVPQCTTGWIVRGIVLSNLGRTEQALAALERGHHLDPYDPMIRLGRAIVLINAGRWDEAVNDTQGLDFVLASAPALLPGALRAQCQALLFAQSNAVEACVRWSTISGTGVALLYSVAAATTAGDAALTKQLTATLKTRHPDFTVSAHRELAKSAPEPFRSRVQQIVYPAALAAGIPESK